MEWEPRYIIVYWDTNNLYSHTMMRDLPYHDFWWMMCVELDDLKENPDRFFKMCHEQGLMFSVMGTSSIPLTSTTT